MIIKKGIKCRLKEDDAIFSITDIEIEVLYLEKIGLCETEIKIQVDNTKYNLSDFLDMYNLMEQ